MNTTALPTSPTKAATTCVVGLGGLFGDDRVGWRVIELLGELAATWPDSGIRLLTAASPADLLGIATDGDRLVMIDACQGLGRPGETVRLRWPDARLEGARHSCGHNVTLSHALEIVTGLRRIPKVCEVWCVEAQQFGFEQPLSPEVESAAKRLAAELFHESSGGGKR